MSKSIILNQVWADLQTAKTQNLREICENLHCGQHFTDMHLWLCWVVFPLVCTFQIGGPSDSKSGLGKWVEIQP